mgnify:CR=1 FL=1
MIVVGIPLMMMRDVHDVLISEDARLVAVGTANGGVEVNRPRPNGFTIQNWLREFEVPNFEPPRSAARPRAAVPR